MGNLFKFVSDNPCYMKISSLLAVISATSLLLASCGGSASKKSGSQLVNVDQNYKVGDVSFEMVRVPSGAFTFGARRDGLKITGAASESEAVMSGYAISKEPVSKSLWAAVMGGGETGDQPVTGVDYKDVLKFFSKLNKTTGGSFRLPTEAMYEYAVVGYYVEEAPKGCFEWTSDPFIPDFAPSGVVVDYSNSAECQSKVVRTYGERKGLADYTKSGSVTFRIAAGPTSDIDPLVKAVFIDQKPERETPNAESEVVKVGDESFDMIGVKGGTFSMGATKEQGKEADSDEKPIIETSVEDFKLSSTEVTVAQWNAVMGRLPYGNDIKEPRKPVVYVSWYDAQEFLLKLNALTGRKCRLPSEAEWEYAARGGVKSRGYLFSGSNECYKVAQFVQNSGSEVKNVGLLVPNELGFYDMSGNVWEWVQDSYHQYGGTEVQNQNIHVQRGGSASSKWDACRVANRQQMNAGNIKNTFGFRIAL